MFTYLLKEEEEEERKKGRKKETMSDPLQNAIDCAIGATKRHFRHFFLFFVSLFASFVFSLSIVPFVGSRLKSILLTEG